MLGINSIRKSLFSFQKKEPIPLKIAYFLVLIFKFNKINKFIIGKYLHFFSTNFNDFIDFIKKYNLPKKDFLAKALLFKSNTIKIRGSKDLNNSQDAIKAVKEIDQNSFFDATKIINLGNEEIESFVNLSSSSPAFNSTLPLTSDLKKRKIDNSYNYYSLNPEQNDLQKYYLKILKNKNLKEIINLYLGFKGNLFAINTMVTKKDSKLRHPVTEMHRDFDDFHWITMFIYWTEVSKDNGATSIMSGSHRSEDISGEKRYLEGKAGSVFLTDNLAFHSGNKNLKTDRIITAMRFGRTLNPASYINKDYLFFQYYNELYN